VSSANSCPLPTPRFADQTPDRRGAHEPVRRPAPARTAARPEADFVVAADHPLRAIKVRADDALRAIGPVLDLLLGRRAKPTIKPSWILRGQVLISLHGFTSDRAFCSELDANPSFRWFLGLRPRDPVPEWWEFARERQWLADSVIGRCFLEVVLADASCGGSRTAPGSPVGEPHAVRERTRAQARVPGKLEVR